VNAGGGLVTRRVLSSYPSRSLLCARSPTGSGWPCASSPSVASRSWRPSRGSSSGDASLRRSCRPQPAERATPTQALGSAPYQHPFRTATRVVLRRLRCGTRYGARYGDSGARCGERSGAAGLLRGEPRAVRRAQKTDPDRRDRAAGGILPTHCAVNLAPRSRERATGDAQHAHSAGKFPRKGAECRSGHLAAGRPAPRRCRRRCVA
jgi:hypothetical protein